MISRTPIYSRTQAMTLVEVVIAIVIAAIVSFGMYGSAVYTSRQAHENHDHQYALMLLQTAASQVRTARFADLGLSTAARPFEQALKGTQSQIGDSLLPNPTSYTLTFMYKGFGQAKSSSVTTLECDIASTAGVTAFESDEWVGHNVMITGGVGSNQMMNITANDADTLTVTSDLTGASSAPWSGATPDGSSTYYIDNGKHCDITISWGDGQAHRTISRRVFVSRD